MSAVGDFDFGSTNWWYILEKALGLRENNKITKVYLCLFICYA